MSKFLKICNEVIYHVKIRRYLEEPEGIHEESLSLNLNKILSYLVPNEIPLELLKDNT